MTHEVPSLLRKPINSVTLKFLPSVNPEHTAKLGSLGRAEEKKLIGVHCIFKK